MAAALLALVAANSPIAATYFAVLHAQFGDHDVLHWVNDGLMTVFFLLVGLEIKRELIDGELSTWPRRLLPGAAALGGMAAPALVYLAIQQGDPATQAGWAIPAATDIAFALGILSLLGRRAPVSLKVFLTALAIIDDLGAVLIIALFYTERVDLWSLGGAGAAFAYLMIMNRLRVANLAAYLIAGGLMWWFMLHSGVHATLAGVLLALAIPLRRTRAAPDDPRSPLHRLERALQPFVAFVVLPIFGFANAGSSFAEVNPGALLQPVPLGVALGLLLGKQLGVFATILALVKTGWVDLPANASWRQVYGVSVLCGVGFTMSLFIGALAFAAPGLQDAVKFGVLAGSTLSALLGALVLLPSSRGSAVR